MMKQVISRSVIRASKKITLCYSPVWTSVRRGTDLFVLISYLWFRWMSRIFIQRSDGNPDGSLR